MKCPKCNGSKSMGFISSLRCDACGGTGQTQVFDGEIKEHLGPYRDAASDPDPPRQIFRGCWVGSPPETAQTGDTYFDLETHCMYTWTGCGWTQVLHHQLVNDEPEQLVFTDDEGYEWGVDWETGEILE